MISWDGFVMKASTDPAKRMLLDQLPRLLRGYDKPPDIDAVIVVLDDAAGGA
jgi:hypothetical protein